MPNQKLSSLIFSLSLLTSLVAQASFAACPAIDQSVKDTDGMPFCPAIVQTSSAFAVFGCAMQQANSFHTPTAAEKQNMQSLLNAFKTSTTQGISASTTSALMKSADALNLQTCRVKQTTTLDGKTVPDSYLLAYTKPGIKNYSGPFLMLRETTASKIMLIGPHDDSDGTYADTKIGLAKSHALVLVSNGHKRGNVGKVSGDFVHETNNLGTNTVAMLGRMFPGNVWLHIHGMSNPDHVLYRSRSNPLSKAYEKAVVASTNIQPDAFKPLNADFTVDSLVNTNYYLKTEIPARIHQNNHMAIAEIAKKLEAYPWAWNSRGADEVVADDFNFQ